MPCLSPLRAFQYVTPNDNGKREVTFKRPRNHLYEEVLLPCGKCLGCKLEYSRQWAVRCVHEASLNGDRNMFLTLTFDSRKVSEDLTYSLEKKLFVDFLKRFRFRCGKLRYFHCGEYGSLNLRPHHHAIIFGYRFPDLEPYTFHHGSLLYRSNILEELWPFGFSSIGDVTFESCAYVARYVTKKLHDSELGDRMPEYLTMSRKPGIGGLWIEKFFSDVYSQDRVIVRNGVMCRPPRFYDSVYARQKGDFALENLKVERKLRCGEKCVEVDRLDLETRRRALSRALVGSTKDIRSVCNALLSAGQGSREKNKVDLTISRMKLLPRELDLIEV